MVTSTVASIQTRPYPLGCVFTVLYRVLCRRYISEKRKLQCDTVYITPVQGQRAAVSLEVCDRPILPPARLIAYVTFGILRHTCHGMVYLSHTSSLGVLLHTPLPSYFNSHFLTDIFHVILHFRQSSYSDVPAFHFPKLRHTVPAHHLM